MGKFTGKGKHIAKMVNHLYTCMISNPVIVRGGEYKCRIFETHFNTHKKKRESKHNTKDSPQITREERERKNKEHKRIAKQSE